MKELQRPEEIPEFFSEAEEAAFWATHYLGESFPDSAELWPEGFLPAVRSEARDWHQEVQDTIEGYGELLEQADLTPIASAMAVANSVALLVEIKDEMIFVSKSAESLQKRIRTARIKQFSPRKVQEMEQNFALFTAAFRSLDTAFSELELFVRQGIELHKSRFPDEPEDEAEEEDSYCAVTEAERILQKAETTFQTLAR